MSPSIQSVPSPLCVLITAGTGPVEVQQFVALLKDHLLEQLEVRAMISSVVEQPGAEPGLLKHVEITCAGPGLESLLRPLVGSHALVQQSTLRPDHKRKRWFAAIHLLPLAADLAAGSLPTISPGDCEFTACRSSGPGGQHVNKTASKVRLRHLPTGITVICGAGRSQHENRRDALRLLQTRLQQLAETKAESRQKDLWRAHWTVERGAAVAVYTVENGKLRELK